MPKKGCVNTAKHAHTVSFLFEATIKSAGETPALFDTTVSYMVCVKVRVMTSICCSLVSELKRTA